MRPLPVLLAACALAAARAAALDGPEAEQSGVWRLVSLDGAPFDAPVTMSLSREGLAGQAPCNRFFASAEKGPPPAFVVGPVGGTEMACDRLEAEMRFHEALSQVTEIVETDATLTLSGPEHILVFTR